MKTLRKLVLAASFALTAMFHSCNPAIAKDEERSEYAYELDDGVVHFLLAPCADEAIVAAVPEAYRTKMKTAVAIATDPAQEKVALCWAEVGNSLVLVNPAGGSIRVSVKHPRMTKRTHI